MHSREGGREGGDGKFRGENGVWGDILKVGINIEKIDIDFSRSFHMNMGNRENTLFWKDVWIGEGCLSENFLRLFLLDSNKEVCIKDRVSWDGGGRSRRWD